MARVGRELEVTPATGNRQNWRETGGIVLAGKADDQVVNHSKFLLLLETGKQQEVI